ncbi:MAG: hypothetical protein ACR2PS_10330 [Pseudomonadales bacterium]
MIKKTRSVAYAAQQTDGAKWSASLTKPPWQQLVVPVDLVIGNATGTDDVCESIPLSLAASISV